MGWYGLSFFSFLFLFHSTTGVLYTCTFMYIYVGYRDHKFPVNALDIAICKPYSEVKPLPVPPEFVDLADILMHENGWSLPHTCEDALKL